MDKARELEIAKVQILQIFILLLRFSYHFNWKIITIKKASDIVHVHLK